MLVQPHGLEVAVDVEGLFRLALQLLGVLYLHRLGWQLLVVRLHRSSLYISIKIICLAACATMLIWVLDLMDNYGAWSFVAFAIILVALNGNREGANRLTKRAERGELASSDKGPDDSGPCES